MLRPATVDDIPFIADLMLSLKPISGWAHYKHEGYDLDTLEKFIYNQLTNPHAVCIVSDPGNGPNAFCGAQLHRFMLPPHMPVLYEWGWGGERKSAIRCWRAVCEWGRGRGAELAGRTTAKPSNSRHIQEVMTWERL